MQQLSFLSLFFVVLFQNPLWTIRTTTKTTTTMCYYCCMAFQSYHVNHYHNYERSLIQRLSFQGSPKKHQNKQNRQGQSAENFQTQKRVQHVFPLRYTPYSIQERQWDSSQRSISIISSSNTKLIMKNTADEVVDNIKDENDMPNVEPLFLGIVRDYKKRLPYYFNTDITDGFNVQCFAAVLFLFFACLAPAVGFGTLYDKATMGAIGTVEVISSTAGCGILYALLSAQPITIIASTGPVLAFVAALGILAKNLSLPFLPLYAWTGLWTAGILFVSAITSSSNMVKYLTKFTDEIFSFLISAIFVVNAFTDIGKVFTSTSTPLTKALLTLVTASTTFIVSITLRRLRQSVFFTKSIRNTISSFAPTIGILSGAFLARFALLAHGAATAALPALKMPNVFGTTTGRAWLIPIFDLPVWARWAAFLPAIMSAILLFFDQNITVRLVNNPKWKMIKGRRLNNIIDGMHADMLVISFLVVLQSLFGLPWLIASTVHSVAHVQALANYDQSEQIISSTEQRVTGAAIHALIGCCVIFAKPRLLLSQLSLPVFTGLFLYLGVTGLSGIEMWQRLIGIFKDKSFVETKGRWTDTVPRNIVNRYTAIQLLCLALMYGVKESKQVGVFFPVVIAALAPIRFALEKTNIIPTKYIDILDEE